MTAITAAYYGTNLKLPAYPQVDPNKYPDIYADLQGIHQAVRNLQSYLDLYTGAKVTGLASGSTINAGQFVTISAGDPVKVKLANATNYLLPCRGFAVTTAIDTQSIDVQTFGIWPYGNGALTVGADYYLDTTSGGITVTAPVGAGKLVQYVGTAIDVNNLLFRPAGKYKEL